ncbi:hypothetical protein [Coleofasciculus sp. E1-EBD-02]
MLIHVKKSQILTVPCSLFPVPCSLFPVPCSLFPVPFVPLKGILTVA